MPKGKRKSNSTLARAKPLALQIEDERQKYYAVLSTWTDETHRRLMREMGGRLFAYYWPSTATDYGKLASVADGQQPPPVPGGPFSPGWKLITPEPVPISCNRAGLYAWIKKHADYLPMYPSEPRETAKERRAARLIRREQTHPKYLLRKPEVSNG